MVNWDHWHIAGPTFIYSNCATALSGQNDEVSVWNRVGSEVELLDLLYISPIGAEPGLGGL